MRFLCSFNDLRATNCTVASPLSVLLLFFLIPTFECVAQSGDTDLSGSLDVADRDALISHIVGRTLLSGEALNNADVNADGVVDAADVAALSQLLRPPENATLELPPEMTSEASVTLMGTASLGSTVEITGGPAKVTSTVDGAGVFSVAVDLHLNRLNRLFVTVVTAEGERSAPWAVAIIQDLQAPSLFIDFPVDGAELTNEVIVVAGRVSDTLSGFMGLEVTVNGQSANVDVGIGTNGTFERGGVELADGENVITVTAVDELGNEVTRTATYTRVPVGDFKMEVVSGNTQTGTIQSVLPEPLVVRLTDPSGAPFANKIVNFKVIRNNARLMTNADSGGGSLTLQVRTDPDGLAQAYLTLGLEAGCGNNRIEVTSTGVTGTTFFCASAMPLPPQQINVGTGNNQRGESGARATEPLTIWVSDGCNGVPGVPVTFFVSKGTGTVDSADARPITPERSLRIQPKATSITVLTGVTGHASVDFFYGSGSGNSVVDALLTGVETPSARFVLESVSRDPSQPTTFTGIVHNNNGEPIEGAICIIEVDGVEAGETTSDTDGHFTFSGIPDGSAHLRVNGFAATSVGGRPISQGTYPALAYEVVVIPNAENNLPRPVLLPLLNSANERTYDGTQDVVLTVEGMEGLEMRVRAGSMTLADGTVPSVGSPAVLTLNQVHHDDIPMPIPDGAAPPFAWTLQPAGAHFDPPVEIKYPNMTGLPAGAIAYFLSFNHDTGKFEIVTSGSVSADGASIVSDPGGGIATAGWGCNCPPYAVTGDCEGGRGPGTGTGGEGEGEDCMVTVTAAKENADGDALVCSGKGTTFSAMAVPTPGTLTWSWDGGATAAARGLTFRTGNFTGAGNNLRLTATWKAKDQDGNDIECSVTKKVIVLDPDFEEDTAQAYGYDSFTDKKRHRKSIEVGKTDTMFVKIAPDDEFDEIAIDSSDDGKISVTPKTPTSKRQKLTLTAKTKDGVVIRAKAGEGGSVCELMDTWAYNKVSKTLAVTVIHGGDDEQIIKEGQGAPFEVCVRVAEGGLGELTTFAGGDDVLGEDTINTGKNGVCESLALLGDEQVIPLGQGLPHALGVFAGDNGVLETDAVGDDVGNLPGLEDEITTGEDGICNTKAVKLTSTGIDIAALRTFLNSKIFNQAVVEWTVTLFPAVVAKYDLNKDGKLDTSTWMTAEMQLVRDAAKQDAFDKNLFMVDDGSFVGGLGFARLNQRYTYMHVNQILAPPADSPNLTAAHEVGHSMGLSHVYEDNDPIDANNPRDIKNLMDPTSGMNKVRLRWNQWNKLNP